MKKILSLTFLWLSSLALYAQDYSDLIQKADSVVQVYFNENSLPGMSVSIFTGDDIIFSKGYGFADIENKIPVDPSKSKFRVGSVSKTFTATGLGLLIQQNKVDPEATIQTYVSGFPDKKWPITVKQVSGHIAGIRHYRGDEFMSDKKYETIDEGLEIFEDDPLLFEPGTQYQYSSYGWNLISAVIEGASGQDFLPYMKTEVFEPLGMNNTEADWADKEITNRVKFYIWRSGQNEEAPYVDNSYKWAGGGFVGTTEDMIRFGEAHFDYDFLDEETQELMMTPQQLSNGESTNYGMGWSYLNHRNTHWIGHSGGSVGGSTMFLINKKHNMIIAYAINRSGVSFNDLHFKLADIFISE